MPHRNALFVFGLFVLLSVPCSSSFGQLRGELGAARGGGARGGLSPRSGLGFRSNPIANPAPSLTPSEVLNPRGSLSTGQVLNPSPSLNRPRSGGALPATQASGLTTAARYQSARPAGADDTAVGSTVPVPVAMPAPTAVSAGEQILFAAVALDQKLDKVAPDKGWSKRLSLDDLRDVPAFSEQPADDSKRTALESILKVYQGVAKDDSAASISKLPEFKQTLDALQNYLTPIDVRQRQRAAASFQQLAGNLRRYKNGESWVKYLVPAELTGSDNKVSVPNEQAEKLLKRFDKIAGNPVYQKVTSQPAFAPAHNAITAIVAQPKP